MIDTSTFYYNVDLIYIYLICPVVIRDWQRLRAVFWNGGGVVFMVERKMLVNTLPLQCPSQCEK